MKQKILIIRFSSLGDIVLTSSAVLNVKINFPDSHIVFFCKEKFAGIVKMIKGVDEVATIPDDVPFLKFISKIIELDKNNFDCLIDLHGNIRSWWVRKIINASNTVVYPKRRVERALAVKNKEIPENYPHTVDLYNTALVNAGMKVYASRPHLMISDSNDDDKFENFSKNNNRFVFFAPGAAHFTKQWPVERFAEAAEIIHKREKIGIVWAATSASEGAELIESKLPSESLLYLKDHPLDKLSRIISNASLSIVNDSGISHISSAVGTPVIALFGPTHPVLGFAPKGLHDQIMQVDESCRPCSLHGKKECFREKRFCFTRISPEIVANNAISLLKSDVNKNRAVFVDRDGTIIVDKHFLSDPDGIEFEKGAVEGLKRIQALGYKIVIISNQSGVARGYFGAESVDEVNARLTEMLAAQHVLVDAIYFCPHYPEGPNSPFNIECNCRKPAPGMAEEAAYQLGINLRNCYVIGDKVTDMNLSEVIGGRGILVRTGYGLKSLEMLKTSSFYEGMSVVDNLETASRLIEEMK